LSRDPSSITATVDSYPEVRAITGRYLHVQRLSTEDGPGIRSTVFFKGCALRCAWCHNPESLSFDSQIQWLERHCIGCDTCLHTCPEQCLQRDAEGVHIDRRRCNGCGLCVQGCPAGAMELLGRQVSIEELLAELLKDLAFYEQSGGGVTLSGGEPLMQSAFTTELMAQLRAAGIHTALDTCGLASPSALTAALAHADLVLYDLKEIDPSRHKDFTRQSNQVILQNLLLVRDLIRQGSTPARLWIRTPLIPAATARRENLEGIGAFLANNLDGLVERWELCAFNNLCRDKYRRLDMDWAYASTSLLTKEELAELESWAKGSGVDPHIVVTSGVTGVI
jgi:pyruvate formate lyase activating enzyme